MNEWFCQFINQSICPAFNQSVKTVGLPTAAATLEMKLPGNVTTYVVFTGSLIVEYAVDQLLNITSATINLVEILPTNHSIVLSTVTSFDLPKTGLLSGEFSLTCGTIDHAGRYRLQLDFVTDVGRGSRRTASVRTI